MATHAQHPDPLITGLLRLALLVAIAAGPLLARVAAADIRSQVIAVMPLDATRASMDENTRLALEEVVRTITGDALSGLNYTVLTGDNTLKVLRDNGIDAGRACEASCSLDAAQELKAGFFISGSVLSTEGLYLAVIRLSESAAGKQLSSVELEGKTVRVLREQFKVRSTQFFAKLTEPGDRPLARDDAAFVSRMQGKPADPNSGFAPPPDEPARVTPPPARVTPPPPTVKPSEPAKAEPKPVAPAKVEPAPVKAEPAPVAPPEPAVESGSRTLEVYAWGTGSWAPLASTTNRTIGAEAGAALTFASAFTARVGAVIGPQLGVRAGLSYTLLDDGLRVTAGVRGAAWPAVGLFGGGPVLGVELPIAGPISLSGALAAEGYAGSSYSPLAVLGSLGVCAGF